MASQMFVQWVWQGSDENAEEVDIFGENKKSKKKYIQAKGY